MRKIQLQSIFWKIPICIWFVACCNVCMAQQFLNGSFEKTTAIANVINMPNKTFDNLMPNCYARGYYGNLDILTDYYSNAQDGNWYIALTGGGTDVVFLELSEKMKKGSNYMLVFHDKASGTYVPKNFELGLSDALDTFGTSIYFTPTLPNNTSWTRREVFFTAPLDGKYITLRTPGTTVDWTLADNFKIDCIENLFADTVMCEGEVLTLNPNLNGATYLWQDKSENATFIVSQPGKYWVTAKTATCTFSDTINVTYKKSPTINLGNDTSLCYGESLVLDATTPDAKYLWFDNSTSPVYTVKYSAKFWVKVSIGNCTATDTINIAYYPKPEVYLGNDTTLCEGEKLTLKVNEPLATYLWQNGSTSNFYTVTAPGIYWAKVSRSNCVDYDTIKVSYNAYPFINLGKDTSICPNTKIILGESISNATYIWNNGNTNAKIEVTEPGIYWVQTSLGNCISSDTITITPNQLNSCNCFTAIPNSFTPNNDNLNENFLPYFNCQLSEYNLKIYNRWGEIVFESNVPTESWNGKFKNTIVPEGVYLYKIISRYKGNYKQELRSGTITVLR